MLTPDLFGGISAIRCAGSVKSLSVDPKRLDADAVQFHERAYALLVQSITDPQKAEAIRVQNGATLTPGRLIPNLDATQRQAIVRLMIAVPGCTSR